MKNSAHAYVMITTIFKNNYIVRPGFIQLASYSPGNYYLSDKLISCLADNFPNKVISSKFITHRK